MIKFFNSILCMALIVSCKQDLCKWSSQSDNSAIQVTVDWSESNMDQSNIHNLSIYAYPEDGGAPYIKVSGNIESSNINLPSGLFSLLVFNDIVGDIAGINFGDIDTYDKFYAGIIEQKNPGGIYYDIEDDEILASNHEQIAAWNRDSFEVTSNMVTCVYCDKIHSEEVIVEVSPTPITTQCTFVLRVENLYNAQIIQGVVKGFAAGAYMVSAERIANPDKTIIYGMDFSSKTYYDNENGDGVTQTTITTFGKYPDESQTYTLELYIILNNGELATFTRDITDQVTAQENVNIVITLESDDNMIVLPESDGTRFGVEAWGERDNIELL